MYYLKAYTNVNFSVGQFLAQLTTKLVSAIESVVANALGNGSNGKESNEKSRIPTNEEGNVRSNNGKTHTSKTVTDFEMNRKTNSVSGNKVKDVEYSCSSKDSSVLVVGNCRTRSKTSVVTPMDKRLMTFVCGWKELRDNTLPGPTIIECDGIDASLLSGFVW